MKKLTEWINKQTSESTKTQLEQDFQPAPPAAVDSTQVSKAEMSSGQLAILQGLLRPLWQWHYVQNFREFVLARNQRHKKRLEQDIVVAHPQREGSGSLGHIKTRQWHMQLLFTSTFNIPSNYVIKIPLATAFPRAAHYHHPNISQSLNNRVVLQGTYLQQLQQHKWVLVNPFYLYSPPTIYRMPLWLYFIGSKQSCYETSRLISVLESKKSRLKEVK